MMRLSFPNGEHPDLRLDEGDVSIGSAADNRVAIADAGLAPHHARIVADRRGAWLHVSAEAPPVHLNARPVRELAMLRKGDVVCLGHVHLLLCADEHGSQALPIPPAPPADDAEPALPRVVLRGVAGAHFGRSHAIERTLLIGRGEGVQVRLDNPAAAERHAQIELHGERVVLRRIGGEVMVNGMRVGDSLLAPGDQLVIESDRFVLEAPGLARPPGMTGGAATSGVPNANHHVIASQADEDDGVGRGVAVWWLIAAAAVLAAVITAVLVYGPRATG
ncbi:MAG: FHA domain-containing protein [Rehaibacterium terrae]|uniref:FHA domain-containing protein n=1 Tax=Rehaibacterium terrae TaxID=1341696 RepID=UPI0039193A8F